MKRIVSVYCLLALLVTLSASAVHAHFTGRSAVDSGEIRWDGSTTYTSARDFGISVWNSLGSIDILPDNVWVVEDLTY